MSDLAYRTISLLLLTHGVLEIDEAKRKRVLHLTCCLLPKSHRDTLEILFSFLVWASSFSQVDEESGSKMDTHNLATVITPNILKDKTAVVGQDENSFLAIEVVNTLIEFNDEMSEVRSYILTAYVLSADANSRSRKIFNPSSTTLLSSTTAPT